MSELGPEARAVVDAGRAGDDPTARDRARVRAALMATVMAGGAGAASVAGEGAAAAGALKAAAAAGAVGASGWGWHALVFGVAMAGALGTTVAVMRPRAGDPANAPAEQRGASTVAPVTTAAAPSLPVSREASAPPAPTTPGQPAVPSSIEGARHPVSAFAAAPHGSPSHRAPDEGAPLPPASEPAAPAPLPVDPLAAETRGLGEAHGALKDGDAARALALLDQQSVTFATGQLREERAAARILALCQLGRAGEARSLAARFLAESPRSVLADRVRAACPATAAGSSR